VVCDRFWGYRYVCQAARVGVGSFQTAFLRLSYVRCKTRAEFVTSYFVCRRLSPIYHFLKTCSHILGLYSYKRRYGPFAFVLVHICRWSQYSIWNVTLPVMAASEQAIHRKHFVLSAVPASYLEKLPFHCYFLTKKAVPIKVCLGNGLQFFLHRASILKLPNPSTFHIKRLHMAKHFRTLTHSCWAFIKIAPSVRTHEKISELLNEFVGAFRFYLKSVSVSG
jgi:hypothetical protein